MEAMKQIAKEDEGALYYPEFQFADEMETEFISRVTSTILLELKDDRRNRRKHLLKQF